MRSLETMRSQEEGLGSGAGASGCEAVEGQPVKNQGATVPITVVDVERSSTVAGEIPARLRGSETLPAAMGVAEDDQFLAPVAALGPGLVHDIQQGLSSIIVGHPRTVSSCLLATSIATRSTLWFIREKTALRSRP